MREFDDNPHSYGPVLRRIAILAAVIITVPAMLWAITSFMHTYVAQPVIASPKPLAAPATTASINTGSAGAAAGPADKLSSQPASPVVEATATDSTPPASKVASLATADAPSSATPAAPAQPTANTGTNWPAIKSPDSSAAASDGAATDGPWPDPKPIGAQQAASPAATTASDAGDDALPATPPLTGRIPLPPHRPAVLAMAVTGAIPLPRARPSDAGAPAESPSDSGGSGFFTHLFGQTH